MTPIPDFSELLKQSCYVCGVIEVVMLKLRTTEQMGTILDKRSLS